MIINSDHVRKGYVLDKVNIDPPVNNVWSLFSLGINQSITLTKINCFRVVYRWMVGVRSAVISTANFTKHFLWIEFVTKY